MINRLRLNLRRLDRTLYSLLQYISIFKARLKLKVLARIEMFLFASVLFGYVNIVKYMDV